MGALHCIKKSQFLHAAFLGYNEQFFQFWRHSIRNTYRPKNPRPDLSFEFLMNFKRDLKLPKKSGKLSKLLS
jgi:hypothetical protein